MNIRDYDLEEEEQEYEEELRTEEEYNIWKKNTSYLYDLLVTQSLNSPSLTVDYFTDIETDVNSEILIQRVLLGTLNSNNEQNKLYIANIKLPNLEAVSKKDINNIQIDSYKQIRNKLEVQKSINHEGEVNKARIMPQNSDFIATKTISGEIHIFNLNNHPDVPKNDNVYPELRLRGHETEGFGLSWSSKKEGYLVSGANDMNVCLYDVKSNNSNPIRTYKFHSDLVGDVAFSNLDENIFGTAGDDKKMMIYDIREEHPIFSVDAHSLALNCLDFNFFNKNLIITSSNDKLIALWDMRNLSRKLHTFDQHTKEVITCRWNPKIESMFFSSSNDRRIAVWDINKIGVEQSVTDAEDGAAELVFTHEGHNTRINDVAWNPRRELAITSVDEDGIIQFWEMANYLYYEREDENEEEDDRIKIENNN